MNYQYSENDLRIISQQLHGFLPDRIFDAHMHLYDKIFLKNYVLKSPCFSAPRLDFEDYFAHNNTIFKNREIRSNLLIVPDFNIKKQHRPGFTERSLQFLTEQLSKHKQCVGEAAVFPEYSAKDAEALLLHKNIIGFKPYHSTADLPQTLDAEIGDFLSEGVWEVANDRSLCITLHIVKNKALSDESNFKYITNMCTKYPSAKLILAHCARGFASWTTVDKAAELAGYPNIWFDLSAVCESPAIFEVIKRACKRVVWGSDYPVCMLQGKAISISDGFHWIDEDDGRRWANKSGIRLNLVMVEALLAFKQAAKMLELGPVEIEDIFYYNALRLFGVD